MTKVQPKLTKAQQKAIVDEIYREIGKAVIETIINLYRLGQKHDRKQGKCGTKRKARG